MSQDEAATLAEDELLAELHRRGYVDVTKRRLSSWRENNLLPPFDLVGGGRGRGPGRAKSAWLHPEHIVNRAVDAYEYLRVYGNYKDVHLALLFLGYDIPLECMRDALRDPVDGLACAVATEVANGKGTGVEDVLDDAAAEFARHIDHEELGPGGLALFRVQEDSLKALLNIFLNHVVSGDVLGGRDYNLTDMPFTDGLSALRRWEQEIKEQSRELLGDDLTAHLSFEKPDAMPRMIFTHAQFINEHLSVPRLKAVLDGCTEEDLAAVRSDVKAARAIALELKRMILFVTSYIPEGVRPPEVQTELFAMAFALGKWCLLADLSFRRSGYGPLIEWTLATAYEPLKRGVYELECEGPTFMPQVVEELGCVFERLRIAITEGVLLKYQATRA